MSTALRDELVEALCSADSLNGLAKPLTAEYVYGPLADRLMPWLEEVLVRDQTQHALIVGKDD